MRQWIKSVFSRRTLDLGENERQSVAQFSMLGGAMAFTVATALIIYILRYSWPDAVVNANAAILMGYFYHLAIGGLVLIGIHVLTQAAIAIGGKISAEFAGAKFAAEVEKEKIRAATTDCPPAE